MNVADLVLALPYLGIDIVSCKCRYRVWTISLVSWVHDSGLKEAMVICEIMGREEEETWRKRLSVLRIGSENMIW